MYGHRGNRHPAAFDLLKDAFGAIDGTYLIDEVDLIDLFDDEDNDEDDLVFGQDAPDVSGQIEAAAQNFITWLKRLGPRILSHEIKTGKEGQGKTYVVVTITATDPLGVIYGAADKISKMKSEWGITVTAKPVMGRPNEIRLVFSRGPAPSEEALSSD